MNATNNDSVEADVYVAEMNRIVARNSFISAKALKCRLKEALHGAAIEIPRFKDALDSGERTFQKVDTVRASNYAISSAVYYDTSWAAKSGCPEVCIYPEDKIAWELYHGGILPIYGNSENGEATYWGMVEQKLKAGAADGKVWDGIVDTNATHYQETFINSVKGLEEMARNDSRYGFTPRNLPACEADFGHLMFDGVDRIFVGELLECPPGTGYKYIRPAVMRGSAPDSDGRYSVEFIVFNDELLPVEIENEDCFSGFLYDPSIGSVGHPEQLSRQAIECRIAGRRDGMSWLLRAIFGIRN